MSRLTPLAMTVAQAKNLGSDRAARAANLAMADLTPFIRETARRIHGRYFSLQRQVASDFISQSPALIWSRIENFQDWYQQELPAEARAEESKDFFAAWCYRELHYRYLDAGRVQKAAPRAQALEFTADLADPHDGRIPENIHDFALSDSEAKQLAEWDPLDGLILFCLAGQWEQVPAAVWERWLAAQSLRPPFPPADFVAAAKVKRRAMLADALGVSRDVIYQRWLRLKKKYLA